MQITTDCWVIQMADFKWRLDSELTVDQSYTLLCEYNWYRNKELEETPFAEPSITASRLERGIVLNENLRKYIRNQKEIVWDVDPAPQGLYAMYGYHLEWADELVYAGISCNPLGRFKSHRRDKTFDSMRVIAVQCLSTGSPMDFTNTETGIREWEKSEIAYYLPVANRQLYDFDGKYFTEWDYWDHRDELMEDNPELWHIPEKDDWLAEDSYDLPA